MGIFDFLGDLSSKRGKELGLGGFKSLLGTRKAAEAGARGDEMMKITGNDSLPGYFNEQTREYVPWYVDLFDGGGLNSAGGEAAKMPAAETGLLGSGPSPRRASVQAQAAPAAPDFEYDYPTEFQPSAAPDFQYDYPTEFPPSNPNNNLSDMERLNRMPGVDPRNMGGASGYGQQGVSFPPNAVPSNPYTDQSPYSAPPVSENSLLDRALYRGFPAALSGEIAGYNRAALNGNASTSNPSLPQSQNVGPTEFERFKSKFEKQLKANDLWGFPDKIQEILDGLNAQGLNY